MRRALRPLLPTLSAVYGIRGEHLDAMPRGEVQAYLDDLNNRLAHERRRQQGR